MEKIKVKHKADQLIISHKLGKDEQLNAVELDIISRGEIPTLIPVRVERLAFKMTELRFVISNAVSLADRISSDLSFGMLCEIVLGIVETIQNCDSRGIRVSNLELRPEYIFCNGGDTGLRLIYWPLISVAEYANTQVFLKKCGESYRCVPEDVGYRDAYLAYFDSRLKFDIFHFERTLRALHSDWLSAHTDSEGSLWGNGSDSYLPMLVDQVNGSQIAITAFPFTVGRSAQDDYSVRSDALLSRSHMTLKYVNGEVFLCDNGSTNGTQLNGRYIGARKDEPLEDGDTIWAGCQRLVFLSGKMTK